MCSKNFMHTMMEEASVSTQDLSPANSPGCSSTLVPWSQATATCGTLESVGRCRHQRNVKKRPLANLGEDAHEDAFFAEVYDLLGRLSPMRRREAIAMQLSEGQRRGLETWILAKGGKSISSSNAHRIELEKTAKTTREHGPRLDDVCKLHGKPRRSSVMSYSQRSSRTGRTSCWYYATTCLPGLHVIARMRREYVLATADSQLLALVKESVMASTALGRSFDESVCQAFAGCIASSTVASKSDKTGCDGSDAAPARRRVPRAGGAHSQPESLFCVSMLLWNLPVEAFGVFCVLLAVGIWNLL